VRRQAVELTHDHKPDAPLERARIEGVGGMVVDGGRCARVTHPATSMMLATSRCFGDRGFKESWRTVAPAMEAAMVAARSSSDGMPHSGALSVDTPDTRGADEPEAPVANGGEHVRSGSADGETALVCGGMEDVPPLLSPEPCVCERTLAPGDRFIILACDGVWDVLSNQQACDAVRAALEQPHGTPDDAARKLVGDAYNAGSEDNISALVAVLSSELL
jgi:serine/threonine protein phosphatase PrpC